MQTCLFLEFQFGYTSEIQISCCFPLFYFLVMVFNKITFAHMPTMFVRVPVDLVTEAMFAFLETLNVVSVLLSCNVFVSVCVWYLCTCMFACDYKDHSMYACYLHVPKN